MLANKAERDCTYEKWHELIYDLRSDQDAGVHFTALPATHWLETSSSFHQPLVPHFIMDKIDPTFHTAFQSCCSMERE